MPFALNRILLDPAPFSRPSVSNLTTNDASIDCRCRFRGKERDRERERQRERQRDRETETDRERQTERDRERQRETERDRERQRETERDRGNFVKDKGGRSSIYMILQKELQTKTKTDDCAMVMNWLRV